MSYPWGKIEKPESVKLDDIISEEVARDLHQKEQKFMEKVMNKSVVENQIVYENEDNKKAISSDGVENDKMIAQMLQMQFDKEYDEELKRSESKFNGASKVSISFDNYRRRPLNYDFESDYEDDQIVDVRERKDWDRFETLHREYASIPPCGYKIQKDGKMVTKHDVLMSGRKNACKLLSFPPEFQTGDGESFDLKLSNKVFNSLKMHSRHEQTRRQKIHDKKEEQATAEFGVDQFTRLLLYKMINNRLLQQVNGVISIGKEAVILHADSDPSFPNAKEHLPEECVIKVFKTTLSEFKHRDEYIKDDYRFKNRIGKQTTRKFVHLWAEKEMANLMRLNKAGILCPQVVTLKNHILVMSFIGQNHKPAPKLKDAVMERNDYIGAYNEVIEAMRTLYDKANLIHADLSEYNILWYHKQCYFIDVSQSVEPSHENAFHFLYRDCNNITNFFRKKNVPEILSSNELFKFITGYDFGDKLALLDLRESFKMKPHLIDKPGVDLVYNFDTAWDKAENGEIPQPRRIIPDIDLGLAEFTNA